MRTYTEEQRLAHIKQQSESGLTIQAYCDKYSVNFYSFKNWRKRYVNNIKAPDKDSRGTFVEVTAPRAGTGLGLTNIYLPNGVRLQLDQELDDRLLKLLSDV